MATTLQEIDTEYCADSIEWCPHPGYQDVLLCGTYQLDQSKEHEEDTTTPQTRLGKLHLYKLKEDDLLHIQTRDMPGILDIKWCPSLLESQSLFGLVNSIGQLQVHRLTENFKTELVNDVDLGVQVLGLSLDWSNRVNKSSEPEISCSTSDGHISICRFHQGQLTQTANWKAHDFEAWVTAFNYWNTNVVYSGGDDCRLKGWDLRQNTSSPIFVCKRHTMGVCSIQSHPYKEHILGTGSYDENIMIWDDRNMKSSLAEINVGGGVWRIKWDPHNSDYILTASMYNGFHVIDASLFSDGKLSVVCHYEKHKSIGYGADINYRTISPLEIGKDSSDSTMRTIATCSFYDHLLNLWKISFSNSVENKET